MTTERHTRTLREHGRTHVQTASIHPTRLAAALATLMLAGCSGGGGSTAPVAAPTPTATPTMIPTPTAKPALSDQERNAIRSNPRVQRLTGILGRSDTLLASRFHLRYSSSIRGVTASDRIVESFSCTRSRCVSSRDTAFSVTDLADPFTGANVTEVNFGSMSGFDTVSVKGRLADSTNIPDDAFTGTVSASTYGFWGDHGYAGVDIVHGAPSGRILGGSFTAEGNSAFAYTAGDATGTNPAGMGRATWRGIADAASTRTPQRRQGIATVTIADLSRPRVGVVIDISGFDIGSNAWADMPLVDGRFRAGTPDGADYMEGNFHGPNHSETYGVFDTGAYVGAFGAKRAQ